VIVGVGISLDEFHRAHNRKQAAYERVTYPLLDLRLNRSDCMRIIRDAGLPVPGKSACWFCPFSTPGRFGEMRRDRPELFQRACALEDQFNRRRTELGRDPVWLTRFARPLAEAVPAAQDTLPDLAHVGVPATPATTAAAATSISCRTGSRSWPWVGPLHGREYSVPPNEAIYACAVGRCFTPHTCTTKGTYRWQFIPDQTGGQPVLAYIELPRSAVEALPPSGSSTDDDLRHLVTPRLDTGHPVSG
jgi:hypothetical protein